MPIKLISTDFDGTIVNRVSEPVLDADCMELIQTLQRSGTVWAVNTGRTVDLLEMGLEEFGFSFHPDFILTSERELHRPAQDGTKWEAFGDWNQRCAVAHAELFTSADSILHEVVEFVTSETNARIIHENGWPAGFVANSTEEVDRVISFIEAARLRQPLFNYQRNTVYLRFCHVDYHKGAVLGELARLLEIDRAEIFAAGDHHNDISMLDGRVAAMTGCPSNAIPEVKDAVRSAAGYVANRPVGAGIYDALQYFIKAEPASSS